MDWIGPGLGLLGALIATGVGVTQWRKDRASAQFSEYNRRRAQALEELRECLVALELASRNETASLDDLKAGIRPINRRLIENRHLFDEGLEEAARGYVEALIAIHEQILAAPPDARFAWADTRIPEGDGTLSAAQYHFRKLTEYEFQIGEAIRTSWRGKPPKRR